MSKIISLAPGRTCLFGDHQDYLGLPVIACAINRNITLTAEQNDKNTFVLNMVDINEVRKIDINETFTKLEPRDYFASSLRVLRRHGCIPTVGYDITITGNIPINSGTSSSSALLMAWIRFLITAFGVNEEVTPDFISKIGYASEVLEHGEPGGMMDHFSIGVGNVVHINTKDPFSYKIVRKELAGLITGVSGIPKETIGLIGELKGNALMAIDVVKQNCPFFDLNAAQIEDLDRYRNCLPDRLIPYFEAAILNYHYTKEALKEFEKSVLNLQKIGELMNKHHEVLRDLLKITVPRIDAMIDAALKAGAYGAKIVGSGGGGSIVAIANPDKENQIIRAILDAGAIEAYAVSVDPGVRIIENIKNLKKNRMHKNLVILAGGASSRMKKETVVKNLTEEEIAQANERSKGLIGVGANGRPLLDYLLLNAKKAGYEKIYVIIGEQGDLFKEFYGSQNTNNNFQGLNISFAVQYIPKGRVKPFGTADALLQAVEQFPELNADAYSVCNSDNLYSTAALLALRKTESPNAFISYDRKALDFPSERISRFAIAKLDENNQLLDILEKPSADVLKDYKDAKGKIRVSMNAFKFNGAILYSFLKNCPVHPERDEKELPTVLLNAAKEFPNTTLGIPFSEHVPDLTAKEDIADVKAYLKKYYPKLDWEL